MTSTEPTPNHDAPDGLAREGVPSTIDFGDAAQAEQLVQILDQYLADLKAGKPVDRAALLARHPALSAPLEACLAGLEFIQGADGAISARGVENTLASRRVLGDFRILREVGRGGMGAVYEAEQLSLGRRVALKVLRFAGVSDPEALDRFRREAETIARLHHTNIVPIFAVGCEHGVNFYAMQFIDGRSLAEVNSAGEPADIEQVLHWGLQAAEALAHAHERHVIHRDVKPSNLLLDNEGRLWLTDFGLALRLDDVTLSMTGTLLGTPRYMSPEQASASRQQVDHRTDIYSLGATLYELLSGRPAFNGDSPHRVIQQILTTDPPSLRGLCPHLTRDVETVVMKCLSKEPAQRYDSARDLAEDLRACLDHRPIRARRASLAEQVLRWARGHQHAARITGAAVAVTLLFVASVLIGQRWYDAWRRVPVLLTTPSPPLTVEFLEPEGKSVLTAALPLEQPLVLRDGEYDLRLASPDRWTQTMRTRLTRGESETREVDLDDQQLWLPTATPRWFSVVDDNEGALLLLWNDDGVVCQAGLPKKRRWSAAFLRPRTAALDKAPGLLWPWFAGSESAHQSIGATSHAPVAAARTVDVNRDGVGDILVAARHQAFVLALSGVDGSTLWCSALAEDVKRPSVQSPQDATRDVRSATLGDPLVVRDYDGDGVEDLVVASVDAAAPLAADNGSDANRRETRRSQRSVELLSGATGNRLWVRSLPDAWFDATEDEIPDSFRWIVGRSSGASSSASGSNFILPRHYIRSSRRRVRRTGPAVYVPEPPQLLMVEGEPRLALTAGNHVVWLDPSNGELALDQTLPSQPVRPVRWADIDGDGHPEVVYVEEAKLANMATTAPAPTSAQTRLIAWSTRDQKSVWAATLGTEIPITESWTVPMAEWPITADLDGDGAAEVIAPDGSSAVTALRSFVEVPWGEVAVFDGRTGQTRWREKIVVSDQRIDRMAVGPDLDGDGTRELFIASLAGNPVKLHMEARSGQNGKLHWLSSFELRTDSRLDDRTVATPQWWNNGEDGWPQLIVSVHSDSLSPMQSDTLIVSAKTGRLTRKRRQVASVQTRDVDHDGVEDLIAYRAKDLAHPEDGGEVDCVRGVAEELWNWLGPVGSPEADFNGDGTVELVRPHANGTVSAVCGRTHRVLWETRLGQADEYSLRALNHEVGSPEERMPPGRIPGDIDGDGTVDLAFWPPHFGASSSSPLGVVSGRTGRVLWRTSELAARISDGVADVRSLDVDGDGQLEVVALLLADIGYPQGRLGYSSDDLQLWLVVLSGQSGRLRWKAPLSCAYGPNAPSTAKLPVNGTTSFPARTNRELLRLLTVADLDSDGQLDLLAPAIDADGLSLRVCAYRGRDGVKLWEHALPPAWRMQEALKTWYPAKAADLDRDGKVEVVLLEQDSSDSRTAADPFVPRVCVLEGATGLVRRRYDGERRNHEYTSFQNGQRCGVSEIVLPRTADGSRVPAVLFMGPRPELLWCDDPAQPKRMAIEGPIAAGTLWCRDVDGDGADEVALVANGEIQLWAPNETAQPRWRLRKGGGFDRIVGLLERETLALGEIVALRTTGENLVHGIDWQTGRVRWTCAGPLGTKDRTAVTNVHLWGCDEGSRPPVVLMQLKQKSYCRRAAYGDRSDAVANAAPWETATNVSRVRESFDAPEPATRPPLSQIERDPRWARDLPWVAHAGRTSPVVEFVTHTAFYSVTLILLPLALIIRAWRRRRWGLRSMFGLTALAALAAVVTTTDFVGEGHVDAAERWLHAVLACPPLWFLWRVGVWAVQRRWRQVVSWIGITVGLSVLLAATHLLTVRQAAPSFPEEYYVADQWYLILDLGWYITSLMALLLAPILHWWSRLHAKEPKLAVR